MRVEWKKNRMLPELALEFFDFSGDTFNSI